MSDPDDEVSHVFDQTNGVLDGVDDRPTAPASDAPAVADAPQPTSDDAPSDTPRDDAPSDAPRNDAASDASRNDADDVSTAPLDEEPAERTPDAGEDVAPPPATEEHTYAVDAEGTATDEGPEAADARADSSTAPTDDASHPGRLADAYATGPSEEVREDDRSSGAPAAYAAGPGAEVQDDDRTAGEPRAYADGPKAEADRSGDPLVGVFDDDGAVAHVFDQTNGVVEGVTGDSDGTAESDTASRAERRN